jgi:hypothetical protein
MTYQECLKNNTIFKLSIDFNLYSVNTPDKENFTEILLDNMRTLTEAKFSFDVKYVNKLILSDKNYKKHSVLNGIISSKKKSKENQLPALINVNFNAIKNSNLLLCTSEKINTIIAVLNMETSNLEKINSLLFDKQNVIESELVKLSFENDPISYYTLCGYGKIHYN